MATMVVKSMATMTAPSRSTLTPMARLSKRSLTDCDGLGTWTCPQGTCYAGPSGWLGCCSVSSCAARTTCIPYDPSGNYNCDINTGGCVTCSNTDAPACVTETNPLMGQFIFYCGAVAKTATLSNINVPFTGSTAAPGSMATSAAASSTVTASPLAAPSNTLVPGLISFSSFSSVPTSSKSTLPSTLTTGIPSSVPSNATTTNDLPTNDQSSSSTLPAGIIAAISIGCLAVVVLILCMVFNHFTTDWRRRIALPNQHNGTPRGTLGGATLPGGTPPAPTYDTESKWNPNPVDENGLGISNMENQESLAMLRRELQQPAPVSNPWSANSIGLGRQVGSSELDGSTMYTLSVNRPIGASSGKGVGDTGVGVSPNALVAGRQPQTSHQRLSAAVSEMGSLAPGGSGSSGGSRPLSPMTISSQTNGATNGMTARGSWKGYMSAETAMAGGWRDDEAHSCN